MTKKEKKMCSKEEIDTPCGSNKITAFEVHVLLKNKYCGP